MYTIEQCKEIAGLLKRTSSYCGFNQSLGQWQQTLAKALGHTSWQHFLARNADTLEQDIETTICLFVKDGFTDSLIMSSKQSKYTDFFDIEFHKEKILNKYKSRNMISHQKCIFSRPFTAKYGVSFYTNPPVFIQEERFGISVATAQYIQDKNPDSELIPYVIKSDKNSLANPMCFIWFLRMKKNTPTFVERNIASSKQYPLVYDLIHALTGIKVEPRKCLMVDPFTGKPAWAVEGVKHLIATDEDPLSSKLSWPDLDSKLDNLNYAQGLSYLDVLSIKDTFMSILDEADI
jgi:hypothetical protein